MGKILQFDNIRLFKLLEMCYYSIISFLLVIIIANILENDHLFPYFFKTYDYDKETYLSLLKDVLIDLVVLVIIIYYLKKIIRSIPFIFAPLNRKYIPSKKNESTIGTDIGMSIVFFISLKTIKSKLLALDTKFKKYIQNIYQN